MKRVRLFLSGVLMAGALDAAEAARSIADAAQQRDRHALQAMLTNGADVNATQPDGTTALHWAAYEDDLDTAKMLTRGRANVKAVRRGMP